jgi:DNA-binding response OmpR family regulator
MTPSDAKQVLIVDDEESMRLLLGRYVASVPGTEITLAGGCEEALRLTRDRNYDLILLDLLMPGIGGIEVLNRVRAGALNAATPVIIVSVLADPDTQNVCRSLNIADYIVKPVARETLIAAVKARIAEKAG